MPEHRCRLMRTSKPMERAIQQELKRRPIKVRTLANDQSLERLVSAVLVEIDGQMGRRYIGLYQVETPGYVITPTRKFQTTGC